MRRPAANDVRRFTALLLLVLPAAGVIAGGAAWVAVPGGTFRSALKYEDGSTAKVAPFALQKRPVTNGEFLAFVQAHPQWRRDRVASVLADARYLWQWPTTVALATADAQAAQPVVNVSWFAAQAYCKSRGARLPTWREWEYVAAADETRRDARKDPAWRERMLGWYSRLPGGALPRAGLQAPDAYGVQDMHGLVWEWTDDFSSLLVSGDARNQGDGDRMKFCGAGSLAMADREDYAVLMRVAMLSSLEARDTTSSLGFRCAKDIR
jgi:formylglycine-generating enzyme required for sulfatase activity